MPEWRNLLLAEEGTDRDRTVAAAVQYCAASRIPAVQAPFAVIDFGARDMAALGAHPCNCCRESGAGLKGEAAHPP